MSASTDLLIDGFGRVREVVHRVVDGLTPDQLTYRPEARANPTAWLVWHLARVQDDHVADAAGLQQVWTAQGWVGRFGLPFQPSAAGHGQSSSEVAAVRVGSGDLLTGHLDAVHEQTVGYLQGPGDDLQHAGQAAYVRGLAERR